MIAADHKTSLELFNGPIGLVFNLINPFTANGLLSWRQFIESPCRIFFKWANFFCHCLSPTCIPNGLMVGPGLNYSGNSSKKGSMAIRKISASNIIDKIVRSTWSAQWKWGCRRGVIMLNVVANVIIHMQRWSFRSSRSIISITSGWILGCSSPPVWRLARYRRGWGFIARLPSHGLYWARQPGRHDWPVWAYFGRSSHGYWCKIACTLVASVLLVIASLQQMQYLERDH